MSLKPFNFPQPNACPRCGPQLELWDAQGQGVLSGSTRTAECINRAATWIQQGQILALKGLGGFHLLVDARNSKAVQRLRDRKSRPTKPLAVMYPSLALLRQDCQVSEAEATILTSAAAPIVLVPRLPGATLAASIAPHQSTVGVMLPYTPLHHLLLPTLNTPVVATSGNRSQEPLCIDNDVAVQELGQIADGFLVHNRPIARPVDDSVVRMMADQPLFLRRARGYAPAPIATSQALPQILAVGGHLKNTVALSLPGQILVSPYIGDLDAASTRDRCQDTIAQLLDLYAAQPIAIACDAHPDYASTQIAEKLSQRLAVPLMPIQHHYAHVLSGLVDQDLQPPVLGIAWDGTGYGQDGTLWGGEFLAIPNSTSWHRVAHLRPFPLPGGNRAIREPRRAALGLLYAAYGDDVFKLHHPLLNAFSPQELKLLQTMLKRGLQTPLTTSMGRLFDGIAALIGVCTTVTYEGEAAIRLESLCDRSPNPSATYPYQWQKTAHQPWILDWQPMIEAILQSRDSCGAIATQFHNTLVEIIVSLAQQVGMEQILLTGGCFQNRYLLEQALQRLRASGFRPYGHRQIPCNDGGLSVGQILAATWMFQTAGGGSCV